MVKVHSTDHLSPQEKTGREETIRLYQFETGNGTDEEELNLEFTRSEFNSAPEDARQNTPREGQNQLHHVQIFN